MELELPEKSVKQSLCIPCKSCDFETNHRSHFREHMRVHHNEVLDIEIRKCTICDFQSQSRQELRKHKEQTGHRNTFFCDKCIFKTFKPTLLRSHIDMKHSSQVTDKFKEHKCEKCDFVSEENCTLKRHIRVKHKKNSFPCGQCVCIPDLFDHGLAEKVNLQGD